MFVKINYLKMETKENYMTPVANKTLNVAAKGFLYKTNQSGKG